MSTSTAQPTSDGLILGSDMIRVESQFVLDAALPASSIVDATATSAAPTVGVPLGSSGKCNILFDPSEYNVVVVHKAGSLQRLAGASPVSGAVVRQAVFLRSTSPPAVALKGQEDGTNVATQQLPTRRKTKRAFVFPH